MCVCVYVRRSTLSLLSVFEHAYVTFVSCVQGSLEQIQSVLNSTEVGLHQLTALVDCRSLHMVSHFLEKNVQTPDILNSWLSLLCLSV